MTRILFVCLGNICRSPMAEYVMRELLRRQGLEGCIQVDSAATSAEELGNPVHPGARRQLAAHGVPCGNHRARQLTRADYESYDLLIGMDAYNLRNMRTLFGGDPEGKCHLLMDFCGQHRDVADPWYTGDFESTWRDVSEGCQALLTRLQTAKGEKHHG